MSERYELHQGDCHEILQQLPSGKFALILTDPPYATTNLWWDQPLKWDLIWPELWRIAAAHSTPIILFAQQPFTCDLINSLIRKNGLGLREAAIDATPAQRSEAALKALAQS